MLHYFIEDEIQRSKFRANCHHNEGDPNYKLPIPGSSNNLTFIRTFPAAVRSFAAVFVIVFGTFIGAGIANHRTQLTKIFNMPAAQAH